MMVGYLASRPPIQGRILVMVPWDSFRRALCIRVRLRLNPNLLLFFTKGNFIFHLELISG
jgi:hypothetical protein